jgi:hypothetical protein
MMWRKTIYECHHFHYSVVRDIYLDILNLYRDSFKPVISWSIFPDAQVPFMAMPTGTGQYRRVIGMVWYGMVWRSNYTEVILARLKKVFSKALWERNHVRDTIEDGSREWITVLACICANGTAIAPGLIY